MGVKIYVDDERRKPDEFDFVARTNVEAIELAMKHKGNLDTISFDHDNMHGADFMVALTSIGFLGIWPDNLVFHTANPVAHEQMVKWAQANAPETTFVDPRFFWPRHLG